MRLKTKHNANDSPFRMILLLCLPISYEQKGSTCVFFISLSKSDWEKRWRRGAAFIFAQKQEKRHEFFFMHFLMTRKRSLAENVTNAKRSSATQKGATTTMWRESSYEIFRARKQVVLLAQQIHGVNKKPGYEAARKTIVTGEGGGGRV